MQLTKNRQELLFKCQMDPWARPHFDVLCAHLEAALDQPVDTDRTSPHGVAAIVSASPEGGIEVADAAVIVAVAWLEAIGEAINDQDGEVHPLLFDEDGVPVFSDTRPLFETAAACGYASVTARAAFRRLRQDGVVPRRALKILGSLRVIAPKKRKGAFMRRSRVVRLAKPFADGLDRDEIARAKAGSLVYSLIARKDGYEAVRIRKRKIGPVLDAAGAPIDGLSEGDADVMDGFSVPLVPCEQVHHLALDHFIQFLDEEREHKARHTYQRLVHRIAA